MMYATCKELIYQCNKCIEFWFTCTQYVYVFWDLTICLRSMCLISVINKYTQEFVEFVIYDENLPIE